MCRAGELPLNALPARGQLWPGALLPLLEAPWSQCTGGLRLGHRWWQSGCRWAQSSRAGAHQWRNTAIALTGDGRHIPGQQDPGPGTKWLAGPVTTKGRTGLIQARIIRAGPRAPPTETGRSRAPTTVAGRQPRIGRARSRVPITRAGRPATRAAGNKRRRTQAGPIPARITRAGRRAPRAETGRSRAPTTQAGPRAGLARAGYRRTARAPGNSGKRRSCSITTSAGRRRRRCRPGHRCRPQDGNTRPGLWRPR